MNLVILYCELNGKWNEDCTIVHQLDNQSLCYRHISEVSPQCRVSLCLFDSLQAPWWKSGEHCSLRWAHSWEVTEKGKVFCSPVIFSFMWTFRSWPSIVNSGLMRWDYSCALPENVYMLDQSEPRCTVQGTLKPNDIIMMPSKVVIFSLNYIIYVLCTSRQPVHWKFTCTANQDYGHFTTLFLRQTYMRPTSVLHCSSSTFLQRQKATT